MPLYHKGSKGKEVKRIQKRLKQLGHYQGPIDGDYGPGTEKAVKSFQRAEGLAVDGKVGALTSRRLFAVDEPKSGPPQPVVLSPSNVDRNKKRLSKVHPVLAIRGHSMINLCAHNGIAVLITQGLRTWKMQDKLYAKGRTEAPIGRRHIVSQAKGGQSFHNFGLAFDIVVLDDVGRADWDTNNPAWKQAGEIGKSVGLEWGGDWTRFKDFPHFQYVGGLTTADCRKLYPSGLKTIWDKVR